MLLDTNALSAFADGDMTLAPVIKRSERVVIPVVVLGEFQFGIIQSRRRDYYEVWLAALLSQCEILSVDLPTAGHYAAIRDELKQKGRPIPANDTWIAALARQYDLPVLTRDRHYDAVSGIHRLTW